MDKKDVRKLLKDLLKTDVISIKEHSHFSGLLKSLKDKEAIELLESEVTDFAIAKSSLENELHFLTRMITASKSTEFTEEELLNAIKRESNNEFPFEILKWTTFDLFKVKEKNDYVTRDLYHAIIGIEFNDKKYTFGYNRVSRSLSYTVNNGPVRWFNFPKDISHDDIVNITIKQILDL